MKLNLVSLDFSDSNQRINVSIFDVEDEMYLNAILFSWDVWLLASILYFSRRKELLDPVIEEGIGGIPEETEWHSPNTSFHS